ncbi:MULTISPECIES: helix-turn-helix domain-containing protein [unclassified Mesorhizobium]|uniref:helix-turn-helix domain-containing protein n=1 Tax=unclassified Mesorhizobium TaxID=325217 RepID=UPI0015E2C7BD|nr:MULTISPECIES: helix-turn-helix transcriptional regulator [unclassified Mesorhizobium]MBZ9698186.1 helix-turn-helix domain-containing protein [Mesorhizobium sp. CO1-1-9]
MTLSNGAKIRELREAAGMTQDKLAAMSRVDRRTVQRAEQGTRLQMETLSSLAAALGVLVANIIVSGVRQEDIDDLSAKSLIVLNRIRSGMMLLNIVRDSYEGTISCEAEPTPENIEALSAVIVKLESLMPQPWERPHQRLLFPLSQRLKAAVEVGEQLRQLEGWGIAFYAGTYTARTQVPMWDSDLSEMFISNRSPYELVTMCRVIIAHSDQSDRITTKANDIFVPTKPPSEASAENDKKPLDDEIPF